MKLEYGRRELGGRTYLTYDGAYYVLVHAGTASKIYLDPDMWEAMMRAKAEIDDLRKKNILESGED
jgi:hypothetical protein